ncbi:MAG TPA: glucokinase, partial [Paracoccus sp. (in: a-proteobacteria)]|nr:glucokinase [Paracoccus sp. (in: a-proteobacteria)]
MAFLLADVGGTNARMALARNGAIDTATITRFRGDDHASFDEVVRIYLEQQGSPVIEGVCVDVAGPVSGGIARLTNRDWDFTEARLCDLTGAPRARLINDLIALGYATPALDGEAAGFLRHGPQGVATNGQRLVVNAGIACLEAEEGHTRLPLSIWQPLVEVLGEEDAAKHDSVEELFAGRGLARLHALRSKTPLVRAEAVVAAAAQGDAEAEATCALYARL